MATANSAAQQWLDQALHALERDDWTAVLDALPTPVYCTDHDGNVTYWNRACAVFAGREPQLGDDRWCVTWRLYTTAGDPLAHDACPMAVAIKERRAVRGAVAIAERPDGSRVAFTPYPTPLFDSAGRLTGAINMLIDVSAEQGAELRAQADRCRRLSRGIDDEEARGVLAAMAEKYAATAGALTAH